MKKYGFIRSSEFSDRASYRIEYVSDTFCISFQPYAREIYITFFKMGEEDKGVNLFNLLGYLNRKSSDIPETKYFTEERDLEESYKKQIDYSAKTIFENFSLLYDFFSSQDYYLRRLEIRKFMIENYPNLFKRRD